MNWFRLKACGKCGGDLVLDDGDWRCLQCATYYYIGLYQQGQAISPGLTAAPIYSARGKLALPGIASQTGVVQADPRNMALW